MGECPLDRFTLDAVDEPVTHRTARNHTALHWTAATLSALYCTTSSGRLCAFSALLCTSSARKDQIKDVHRDNRWYNYSYNRGHK